MPSPTALTVVAGAAALAALACGGERERPAGWPASGAAPASSSSDPWAAPAANAPAAAGGGLAGLGDPVEMLRTVVENLGRPGPYEAQAASADHAADRPHLGVLTLAGAFGELETMSWTGSDDVIPLRAFAARLDELAADPNLTGLLLRVDDVSASLPDLLEVRATLAAWRARGKKLLCHSEGASTTGYLLLSACERIGLAPTAQLVLAGPTAMPVHLKGLLDRLGLVADFLHVGAYKGAAEPLTRDRPSPEMLEVMNQILDQHYATVVATLAAGRPAVGVDGARAAIDRALHTAEQAQAAGLIDTVATFEAFRAEAKTPWARVPLEAKASDGDAMMKLARFVGALPSPRPTAAHVALVYAVGDVIDGGGDGLIGARGEIASRTLTPVLRLLAADDNVKAVVVRIDSGGGSALASEQIWHAMDELKRAKPVVVSMSDVAASGGYYIAAGATKIFAQPDTLTGSIGVVGGKLAPGPALAKLGVTTYPMGRGQRATMFASLGPWTADERAVMLASMQAIYDVFLDRVAAGRGRTRAELEPLAQGRVWTGTQAKANGLIDELGGLDEALAAARTLGGVDAAAPLEVYPPTMTLRDVVGQLGEVSVGRLGGVAATAAVTAPLDVAAPAVAAVVRRTLAQLARFDGEPIQAVALLPIVFE
ncbi:MAG: signal peptide peptidase SppA [Kofleriaceae bacterium]|nr:signal peptide peptidase SppA [Kofleriaceae bacterium]MBP9171180.1 signal peptide peptidase SppA [Kofleriaceae bacterium]MBP9860420.1 signal peptide peptidase SppA [Kofleriaceae bacterium]